MASVKCEHLSPLDSIMDKHVLFCGRRVPLSSLVVTESNNNNQFLDESSLQELKKDTEPLIDTRAADPHYQKLARSVYIGRTMVRPVEVLDIALGETSSYSVCFSAKDFNKKVELNPKQPVHLISEIEQDGAGVVGCKIKRFAWKKSHGGIGQLRNYMWRPLTQQKHDWLEETIKDKDLVASQNDDNKFIIIVGPEGTGKSTLLSYVTELILQTNDAKKPWKWPVRINLNEHSSFSTEAVKAFNLESAFGFLTDHLIKWPRQQTKNLAKSLLWHRLSSQGGGVVLMFDGLDEVESKAQATLTDLIDCLSRFEGVERVFVAGRDLLLGIPFSLFSRLEDQVSTLSYKITDFNRNDKLEYMTKYWKFHAAKELENYPADEVEKVIEECASKVIAIESAETGEETFGNWPFQCKMLAEIFQKDLLLTLKCRNTKPANPITSKSLSYLDLYRLFWAATCDTFHSRIVTIVPLDVRSREDAVNVLTCYLVRVAIKSLFSPTEAADFFDYCEDPPKWIVQNLCQDVVESLCLTSKTPEGLLKLTHPLLAEYLVADFLFKHLNQYRSLLFSSMPIQDLVIGKILVTKEYKGIRIFFDAMLESAIPNADYQEPFSPASRVPADHYPTLQQSMFNNRLLKLVCDGNDDFQDQRNPMTDTRKLCLVIAGRERSVGILSWLFFCAKECIVRFSGRYHWHKSMLFFLNPYDSTGVHTSSAEHELDAQVSERVFRWFEKADSDVLKDLLHYSKDVTILPKVVFDFVLRHKSQLDATFLVNYLLGWGEMFKLEKMLRARYSFDEPDSNCVDLIIDSLKQLFPKGANHSQFVGWFLGLDWDTFTLDGVLLKLLKLLVEHFNFDEPDVRRIVSHALKMDAKILMQPEFTFRDKEEWPLGEILKKDAYSLTNLHRAAMCGSVDAVRKMLKAIGKGRALNDPLANEIIQSIAVLNGLTPLYLAARCGHEDISEDIIQFQHSVFPFETVKSNVIDRRGCLYRALFDAVPRSTRSFTIIEASRCHLKAIHSIIVIVLRHFGRESLYSLIASKARTPLLTLIQNLDNSSAAIASTLELIHQLLGMHGLSDIVCNPLHWNTVAHLAKKSQNEVLELVFKSILTCKGDVALVDFLLIGRTGELESHQRRSDSSGRVVDILSNPVVRRYLPGKLRSSGLERFIELLCLVQETDPKDALSFWFVYCSHVTKPVPHISAILRSVLNEPGLGERKVKDLLLQNDGKDSVFEVALERGWTDLVQVMLDHLPTMAQEFRKRFRVELLC